MHRSKSILFMQVLAAGLLLVPISHLESIRNHRES